MSCISVSIFLFAVSCVLMEVSSQWLSRKKITFTKVSIPYYNSIVLVYYQFSCYAYVLLSIIEKFKRFSWEKCGKPDAPFHLKTLHVYPNAIPSPGIVLGTASASTAVDLTSPLPVSTNYNMTCRIYSHTCTCVIVVSKCGCSLLYLDVFLMYDFVCSFYKGGTFYRTIAFRFFWLQLQFKLRKLKKLIINKVYLYVGTAQFDWELF